MSKTAYLYDKIFLDHDTGWDHPECPQRLIAIEKKLEKAPYYNDLIKITPTPADLKYIELVHKKSYIERVQRDIEKAASTLDSMDTAVCFKSYETALMAVGGCLNMCDAVISGRAKNGFCSIRPPGHHAESDLSLIHI